MPKIHIDLNKVQTLFILRMWCPNAGQRPPFLPYCSLSYTLLYTPLHLWVLRDLSLSKEDSQRQAEKFSVLTALVTFRNQKFPNQRTLVPKKNLLIETPSCLPSYFLTKQVDRIFPQTAYRRRVELLVRYVNIFFQYREFLVQENIGRLLFNRMRKA